MMAGKMIMRVGLSFLVLCIFLIGMIPPTGQSTASASNEQEIAPTLSGNSGSINVQNATKNIEFRSVFVRLSLYQLFSSMDELSTTENIMSVVDAFIGDLNNHRIKMAFVGFKNDGATYDPDRPKELQWASGILMYNSKNHQDLVYGPFNRSITQENFDPMQYLVDRCEENNIEVHAWVPVFKDHIGAEMLNLSLQPESEHSVKPDDVDVREYELSIITEILQRYPRIKGINLDYIRAGDDANNEYRQDPDVAKAVVDFVKDVENITKKQNKILSADVFSSDWAYKVGQDVEEISNHVDVLMPMTYHGDNCLWGGSTDPEWVGEVIGNYKSRYNSRYILAGIQGYDTRGKETFDVTPEQIITAVNAARENGADGFALFNYVSFKEDIGCLEDIQELLSGPTIIWSDIANEVLNTSVGTSS